METNRTTNTTSARATTISITTSTTNANAITVIARSYYLEAAPFCDSHLNVSYCLSPGGGTSGHVSLILDWVSTIITIRMET